MKHRKLIKTLKAEAKIHQPNLYAFIDDRFPKKTSGFFQKPVAWISIMTTILAVSILSSFLVNSVTNSSSSSSFVQSETLPPLRINSDKEALSITSLTSALFVQSESNDVGSFNTQPMLSQPAHMNISFDETMTHLKPYIVIFEQLLSLSSGPIITTEVSSYLEFEWVDSFTIFDLTNNPIHYQLHYSIIEETIVDEETYFKLDGVMMINEESPLPFEGEKFNEDGFVKVKTKVMQSTIQWIETIYAYDANETNILVKKMGLNGLEFSRFKIESEDDKTIVELFFFERFSSEKIMDRFRFMLTESDQGNTLRINYMITLSNGMTRGVINVYVVEVFDENDVFIGYEYLAYLLNDAGQPVDEWRDTRGHHHR
jgi:hypothetical protein